MSDPDAQTSAIYQGKCCMKFRSFGSLSGDHEAPWFSSSFEGLARNGTGQPKSIGQE